MEKGSLLNILITFGIKEKKQKHYFDLYNLFSGFVVQGHILHLKCIWQHADHLHKICFSKWKQNAV